MSAVFQTKRKGAKHAIARLVALAGFYTVRKLNPAVYAQDGLISVHNHDFMRDPTFVRAYERGIKALGGTDDYHWHWRIQLALWVADSASKLDGDFVECGVNKGFLSSAIMEYLDWNSRDKVFYLLDTFEGLDGRYVSDQEIQNGALEINKRRLATGYYVSNLADVEANFAQWHNARIIQGTIPETLTSVDSRKVAYLHLDMNCAPPEVAAADFFWDRLVPGGFVLLDDYAYFGYDAQKAAMDGFAAERSVKICSLPTGQGLMIKPPQ